MQNYSLSSLILELVPDRSQFFLIPSMSFGPEADTGYKGLGLGLRDRAKEEVQNLLQNTAYSSLYFSELI